MAHQIRQENFFELSAWVLFLILGALEILFGAGDMVAGIQNDPAILVSLIGSTPTELKAQDPLIYDAMNQQQKLIGLMLLMNGALICSISLTAFRRGARWAWFTFWLFPVTFLVGVISSYYSRLPGEALPPPFYSGSFFIVLTILWLVLSYKKYFSNTDGG